MVEHLGAITILFAICLVMRVPFARLSGSDSWITYYIIANQAGQRGLNLKAPLTVPEGGYLAYPPLAHFIASRFPEKWWKLAILLLSYLSDGTVSVVVYGAVYSSLTSLQTGPEEARTCALLAGLILLTLPLLMPITARNVAPNARAFGLFLASMYFLCLWASTAVNAAWLVPAFVLLYMVVVASKFAAQALVFSTPLLAILQADGSLLLPLCALLVLVLVHRCSAPAILFRDKVSHFRRYSLKDSSAEARNLLANFWAYFTQFRDNYAHSSLMLRYRAPLLILLVGLPHVVWVLPLAVGTKGFFELPGMWFCWSLTIATSVIFVATSYGQLRKFGESERYFEFSAPAVVIQLVLLLNQYQLLTTLTLLGIIAINLCLVAFLHLATDIRGLRNITDFSHLSDPEVRAVHKHLCTGEHRIATVPTKTAFIFLSLARQLGCGNLSYYHSIFSPYPVTMDSYREKLEVMDGPFVFRHTPVWLRERYGIDRIIVDGRHMDEDYADSEFMKELERFPHTYSTGRFTVYDVGAVGVENRK